jgi:hypothetical protein
MGTQPSGPTRAADPQPATETSSMKTMMTQAVQALAFAIITLAATGTLVLAGLREDSLQGQGARAACLERCPALLASALK